MRTIWLLSTALAMGMPAIAAAQGTGSAQEAKNDGLGEIIVTAQRTAESSQRAAIPLSVVDGSKLSAAGVTQVDRLNELAPALTVEPTSTGNLIFMRGVGNFTVVSTSDPAVAFNYDGVYVGRPTSTSGVFYDLQRVEILKGPQGILYGRNATGGAINILPAQPKIGEFSAHGSIAYGNYNTINAEGAINAPMGDNGAIRIAASTSNHDGYLADGTSDEKTVALRVQMKAELTPNLTIRVGGDYSHNGGFGQSISYYGRYARNPAAAIAAGPVPGTNYFSFTPAGIADGDGVYSAASQAFRVATTFAPLGRKLDVLAPLPNVNNTFYGANAEITWKTGAGTLTVIPAWRYADLDYGSDAGAFIFKTLGKNDQLSLEARFAGNRIGIFDYQIGGYLYDEKIHELVSLSISNTGNYIDQRLGTRSWAAFGRIVANVTDQLRLVGGLRYTKDNKTFDYSAIGAVINCLGTNTFGAPSCPTAPLVPVFGADTQMGFPFPAAGGAPIPVFTGPGGPNYLIIRSDTSFKRSLASNRTTVKGGIEYDIGAHSLLYASYETGYRSGGFSAAVGFETFEPEYITAYTIGSKNRFFDNKLQINLEGFIWEYRNQQVNHVGLDLNGRTANYTQNVGKSRIKGVEVEATALVTPTTMLSASVQYLDAKQVSFAYTAGPGVPPLTGCNVSFNAANASPYLVDCAGKPSYNSPKWTINLAAQQTISLGDYEIVLGADTQYKSERSIGFAYLPEQTLPSVWRSNVNVSFGPQDKHWSISGYVRNLENHRTPVYSSTHPTASLLIASTTAPRTYGVQAGFKF